MGIYNNAVLPTFHHLLNDCGTLNPAPGVHWESKNEESDSEVDVLRGRTDYLSDTHCPRQDSHPPNALAESVNWETIPVWTLGMTNPSSQEALEGSGIFGAALGTHPPYSGPRFGQDPLPTAREPASQTMGRPALSYPVRQMANTQANIDLFGPPAEMERQSTPEMTYADRSSSGASSALDRNGLAVWPGPDHTLSTSDHWDHISFGLLSNPLEDLSSCRSMESVDTLGLRPPGGDQNVVPEPGVAEIFPPSQQDFPTNWLKIPQRRYTPRGDGLPPRSGEITFSVNNARGFNMHDAFRQHFTGLDGRDDSVLEDANGPVSCRLLFPGYPINQSGQIAVRNWKKEPNPIVRSKLAYEIAKRVKQYLDTSATIPIGPSVDHRWTIGRGCMKLEKMYLVSVAWVSKGSVQPEIWVDNSL